MWRIIRKGDIGVYGKYWQSRCDDMPRCLLQNKKIDNKVFGHYAAVGRVDGNAMQCVHREGMLIIRILG